MSQGGRHHVRAATESQWRELSLALAAAFHHDPVLSWLLPDESARAAGLRAHFEIETRHVVLPHGDGGSTFATLASDTDDETGDVVGAALVLPPGRWRTPLRVQAGHALDYARVFRRRLPRALGVLTALERRHPDGPHYYLPYIGVRPDAQRRGLGTALLRPVLDRCDREGVPAYLEASAPDNARLYRRLGFRTTQIVGPLGSPPLELMIRDPAG
jgi:ribosomal protein S18 acetylase RimI-like enzyme